MVQKTDIMWSAPKVYEGHQERSVAPVMGGASQQELVTALFGTTAKRWETLYKSDDLHGRIIQHRLAITLGFVDKLGLEPNSEILDIGCGAGLASVALAQRGHFVEALDIAPAMLRAARERAAQAGVSHRVKVRNGDVHQLAFPNHTFNLVLAIGVTAWLDSLAEPLREVARVLQPGGHLVISAANRWGLHRILDPRLNPVLASAGKAAQPLWHAASRRAPSNAAQYKFYSQQEFDSILSAAGFTKLETAMAGFGPFSLFGRKLLPDSAGVFVDKCFQKLADDNTPLFRSAGRIYIVLARKHPL